MTRKSTYPDPIHGGRCFRRDDVAAAGLTPSAARAALARGALRHILFGVLGRSLAFERGIGELLGLEPQLRRRTW